MTIDLPLQLEKLFGTRQPVVLVTGSGADRVGRHIARRFVEAGYRVILHAHTSVDEAKATCDAWRGEGHDVGLVVGPVDDEQHVAQWIQTIVADYGGLHALVNTAATWEESPLEVLDSAGMEKQWRVNVLGPTLLCRAAGLAMAAQPLGGAIVNIGDWAVIRPYADFTAYLLSKSSIRGLTEIMAVELAQRNPNIRVNAVLPGPVMLDSRIDAADRVKIINQSLVKREGNADDVAAAVQFLIESPFITAVSLPVDGGRSVFAGHSDDIVAHPTYQRKNG